MVSPIYASPHLVLPQPRLTRAVRHFVAELDHGRVVGRDDVAPDQQVVHEQRQVEIAAQIRLVVDELDTENGPRPLKSGNPRRNWTTGSWEADLTPARREHSTETGAKAENTPLRWKMTRNGGGKRPVVGSNQRASHSFPP